MTGLSMIGFAFALSTLKAPLRRLATTADNASWPALLVSLPFALLNVIVCGLTPACFWVGVALFVGGLVQ